jgi:hypothetical protein
LRISRAHALAAIAQFRMHTSRTVPCQLGKLVIASLDLNATLGARRLTAPRAAERGPFAWLAASGWRQAATTLSSGASDRGGRSLR